MIGAHVDSDNLDSSNGEFENPLADCNEVSVYQRFPRSLFAADSIDEQSVDTVDQDLRQMKRNKSARAPKNNKLNDLLGNPLRRSIPREAC